MVTTSSSAWYYRRDVDGLRALAIVPVVLYHYWPGSLGGGFVGVDVFFVISGFLITSILLRGIAQGQFSIVAFYERRARRILPAMFFMLAVTTLLSLALLLPADLSHYGKSLVATTTFVSNVFFWQELGYFDRAAELKPLLHTWSLAVEEQFYLVFPLFLLALNRFARRRLVGVLAACFCASFLFAASAATLWPSASFYLPVTRAWELLMGALLATGGIPLVASARVRDAASILGISLVIGSIVWIDRTMGVPGWVAMFPCLGTALVIYTGLAGGGVGNRALQWWPLVAVGVVSYSLYLWHWPLLVLAHYAANRALQMTETIAVFLVALGLATLSWRYIEQPFRDHRGGAFDRRRVFRLAGWSSAAAAACGLLFAASGGLTFRVPADALRYAAVAGEALEVGPACFNAGAEDLRNDRLCTIGAEADARPSFLVWGDSHAYRLAVPIADIAGAANRSGILASVGWCPPLLDVEWPQQGCRSFNDEILPLVERHQFDVVIMAGKWASYATGTSFMHEAAQPNVLSDRFSVAPTAEENGAVFARAMRRTVERLTDAGVRVVVIGPVPEIAFAVPERVAKLAWSGHGTDVGGPSFSEFEDRQRTVFAALDAVSTMRNTRVVYPNTALCTTDCMVERRGEILYIDDNHLSRAGLDLVKPLLRHVLD